MLKINNLSAGYSKSLIIKDINFTLTKKDFLVIIGENASGKTTLLKSILNLTDIFKGSVNFENTNTNLLSNKERAKIFSYVPQFHTPPYPFKVKDIVLLGRTPYLNSAFIKDEDKNICYEALEKLGILKLCDCEFPTLSGGQKTLVLLARALAQGGNVLLLDEPTASLDLKNQNLVLRKVRELTNLGMIIIMVSHDPIHALNIGNKVLVMENGKILKFGNPKDTIDEKLLRHIYGGDIYLKDIVVNKKRQKRS